MTIKFRSVKCLLRVRPVKFFCVSFEQLTSVVKMEDNNLLFSKSLLNGFQKRESQTIYCMQPEVLDIMETGSDGNIFKNKVNMRYFKEPKRTSYPLDLREGFDSYKFRTFPSSLTKMEKYLMEKDENENDTNGMSKIYAERSALYYMMITPYCLTPSEYNDLTIYATKFNDVIYLNRRNVKPEERKSLEDSYHFKFEQYCFSDEFAKEPRTDLPVDENKQVYCVYRTQLEDFEMYYSAEINGVTSDHEIEDPFNIEELNKCRFSATKLLRYNSSYKRFRTHPRALRWWAQAFLGKTNDIYVGFKHQDGRIHLPIEHVRVQDLPKDQYWKPDVCKAFLYQYLTKIQDKMSHVNCPYTVYDFEFKSTNNKGITYKIHKGKTEISFLNEEFIENMKNKK